MDKGAPGKSITGHKVWGMDKESKQKRKLLGSIPALWANLGRETVTGVFFFFFFFFFYSRVRSLLVATGLWGSVLFFFSCWSEVISWRETLFACKVAGDSSSGGCEHCCRCCYRCWLLLLLLSITTMTR